jgi:quinol monooxygenase YgiN
MWAQLISARLKPGKDTELPHLIEQLYSIEEPGSGLVRATALRDQNDPSRVYFMIVFDSEDAARAREQDPTRQQALGPARQTMAEIFDGRPEFTDLTVLHEQLP